MKDEEGAWNDRMRLQREKERGEGSKEVSDLLTVYTRVREFPLLHKSFRSGKADTTYPFSLTQSSLFRPPCTTCYPPFKRRCISALYTFTLLLSPLLLCWGCCTLFTPLRRALLSFDGESERSHVSRGDRRVV